jgi:hypothetical protein
MSQFVRCVYIDQSDTTITITHLLRLLLGDNRERLRRRRRHHHHLLPLRLDLGRRPVLLHARRRLPPPLGQQCQPPLLLGDGQGRRRRAPLLRGGAPLQDHLVRDVQLLAEEELPAREPEGVVQAVYMIVGRRGRGFGSVSIRMVVWKSFMPSPPNQPCGCLPRRGGDVDQVHLDLEERRPAEQVARRYVLNGHANRLRDG